MIPTEDLNIGALFIHQLVADVNADNVVCVSIQVCYRDGSVASWHGVDARVSELRPLNEILNRLRTSDLERIEAEQLFNPRMTHRGVT